LYYEEKINNFDLHNVRSIRKKMCPYGGTMCAKGGALPAFSFVAKISPFCKK
jgi:hypothetical protein